MTVPPVESSGPSESTAEPRPQTDGAPRVQPALGKRLANWCRARLASSSRAAKSEALLRGVPGYDEYRWAQHALAASRQLGGFMESPASSILLRRAALALALRATAVRHGLVRPSPHGDRLDLDSVLGLSTLGALNSTLSRKQTDLLRQCIEGEAEGTLIAASKDPSIGLAALLMIATELVLAPLEAEVSVARAAPHRRLARWAAATVGILSLVGLLIWALSPGFRTNSLASGKKVSVSSTILAFNPSPQLLVDGDRANLGIHSDCSAGQFAVIDLEKVEPIHRIVVFNRADCCKERAVPLEVLLSRDGTNYQSVGTRTAVFDEWELSVNAAPGRYVKLLHPGAGCFHLAEVEVY